MRNENINQIKSETMRLTGQNASRVRRISNNPLSSSIIILHNVETKADGKKSWQRSQELHPDRNNNNNNKNNNNSNNNNIYPTIKTTCPLLFTILTTLF
jgi:hypothetical protein